MLPQQQQPWPPTQLSRPQPRPQPPQSQVPSGGIRYFDETFTEQGCPDWPFIEKRINTPPRPIIRMSTNRAELDAVLGGGIPKGLTTIYGDPGTGKSKLANSIVSGFLAQGARIIYFFGEDSKDSPTPDGQKIFNVNLMSYKPAPEKACKIILKVCERLQPNLIIIDSMTSVFGATTLAVQEAEIRTSVQTFAEHISGKLAAIGTSEVRGSGYNMKAAGGTGVLYPSIMNIYLEKVNCFNKWSAFKYRAHEGDRVHVLYVAKDRDGKADSLKEYIINYIGDEPLFSECQQWVDKPTGGSNYGTGQAQGQNQGYSSAVNQF